MPKLRLPKEEDSDTKPDVGLKIKQKRKNAHQVRKYFQSAGPTKQKCSFCGWETRENATRMVQHIVQRCNDATPEAREEISASVVDAEERQMQSFYTSHNKKVVHDYFKLVDNDRKRQCVFCRWTTILNLTRMRYHILEMCHYVPSNIRQNFMKQEGSEDSQFDTYSIVNVDDGDRKGLQVVSSSSFEHNTDSSVVEEVVINSVDYIDQADVVSYYGDDNVEPIPEDQPDELAAKPVSEDEIELDLQDDENLSDEEFEDDVKKEEVQFVNVTEGYYTVVKRTSRTHSPPVTSVKPPKEQATEVRTVQPVKTFTKLTTTPRVIPQKIQPRMSEQQSKSSTRLSFASAPRPTIVVKKEDTRQAQTSPNVEQRNENLRHLAQKSVNISKTTQLPKHRVATSRVLHNTPRQVRAISFIKQNADYFSEYKIDTSG